jgi:ADP-ribosylation factor-like protein 2
VGGQKTLRAYWRNYYEATDGLVWVVDAADAARLPDCAAELRALLAEEKARARSTTLTRRRKRAPAAFDSRVRVPRALTPPPRVSQLAGASLLVLANKQDIAGALSLEALGAALGLGELAGRTRHARVVACSAVTGDGLLAGFDWLVGDIASRIFLLD